ncbi:hypothetical protein [Metabacillus sp. RGM 3146]|uniref:hypothetical protein n=1 Tax=Metabacillus sp. RGM 3146 TaxID=3401092 RepID=UPI003B9DB50E
MGELTAKMLEEIEKIRNGFELGCRVGVTKLSRSTQWRDDLEKFSAMEVVDRNQTAAILMKPDLFRVMEYIYQMDAELEQAQIESLFEQRREQLISLLVKNWHQNRRKVSKNEKTIF